MGPRLSGGSPRRRRCGQLRSPGAVHPGDRRWRWTRIRHHQTHSHPPPSDPFTRDTSGIRIEHITFRTRSCPARNGRQGREVPVTSRHAVDRPFLTARVKSVVKHRKAFLLTVDQFDEFVGPTWTSDLRNLLPPATMRLRKGIARRYRRFRRRQSRGPCPARGDQ